MNQVAVQPTRSVSHGWCVGTERQLHLVKRILAGLTHKQVLTLEMLSTLLTVAEGLMNNHPITAVSSNSRDLEPLTPDHLLIHHPASMPPGLFNDDDLPVQKKWRQVQHLANMFWK